jgi:hypothetical protein
MDITSKIKYLLGGGNQYKKISPSERFLPELMWVTYVKKFPSKYR